MQLEAVSAERDGLYEDLCKYQTSMCTLDEQWRLKEKEKTERLQAELASQIQSAQALTDQHKARPCSKACFRTGSACQSPSTLWAGADHVHAAGYSVVYMPLRHLYTAVWRGATSYSPWCF